MLIGVCVDYDLEGFNIFTTIQSGGLVSVIYLNFKKSKEILITKYFL